MLSTATSILPRSANSISQMPLSPPPVNGKICLYWILPQLSDFSNMAASLLLQHLSEGHTSQWEWYLTLHPCPHSKPLIGSIFVVFTAIFYSSGAEQLQALLYLLDCMQKWLYCCQKLLLPSGSLLWTYILPPNLKKNPQTFGQAQQLSKWSIPNYIPCDFLTIF